MKLLHVGESLAGAMHETANMFPLCPPSVQRTAYRLYTSQVQQATIRVVNYDR